MIFLFRPCVLGYTVVSHRFSFSRLSLPTVHFLPPRGSGGHSLTPWHEVIPLSYFLLDYELLGGSFVCLSIAFIPSTWYCSGHIVVAIQEIPGLMDECICDKNTYIDNICILLSY